jgi:hypothetical protein
MPKFIDTNEVVADLGAGITATLKKHGIDPTEVKVNVFPEEIRILVKLEDEE